ncbi:uncharacterized protein KD926_009259 [Aspergillus affinis]|uniref:uncharacterized protein n=1 Tax=Aspergillus affinis TaxID=1070780 RepID=UPI0022FDC38F|nr:uncharacterized protein KD926_009259 [Aspergillus affinis]KAI9039666.1 hypothetical protein KD926_009259 [Aspergillus affinis]
MAPNNKNNESLLFLYICTMSIKANAIDFNQVAAATNLKTAAARMRYIRLKNKLDAELVDGKFDFTKGTAEATEPTEAVAAPAAKKRRGGKRKRTDAGEEDA